MNGNSGRNLTLPFFLTGLGTGIALTLLFAPLSGAAARSLIGRKVNEGEEWIRDKATATEDYVATRAAGLRDRVNEVAEVISRG